MFVTIFHNILLTALTTITNLTASITETQVLQFVLAILCTTYDRSFTKDFNTDSVTARFYFRRQD